MSEIVLKAWKREPGTKGDLNKLRRESYVPGVYYSKGNEAISIYTVNTSLFPLVYTAETHVVILEIEGEKESQSCVIKDLQFDPVTEKIVHFDLLGLTKGEVVQISVPLVLTGQSIGVKKGGVVQQAIHKVDVECLPRHIPDHLEIDITDMDLKDSIHVKDLEFENMKFLQEDEVVVVSVILPRGTEEGEEEAVEEGEEPAEPEVIGKGKEKEE